MNTPLKPDIELQDRRGLTVCGTCGAEDGTVRLLSFGWRDESIKQRFAGATAVALCSYCRHLTANVLTMEHTL